MRSLRFLVVTLLLVFGGGAQSHAAEPFVRGWDLDPAASTLRFQSVKNETKVETSSFAAISGGIDETGLATMRVSLDSINTGVDLRNVRMRFLFFETYVYPEAIVTATVDPALLAGLETLRRKIVVLPFKLDLHGVTKESVANVSITLLSDDIVSVASDGPISIAASDHNLDLGITKLEEAANVQLIPSATVTFDFTFRRRGVGGEPQVAVAPAVPAAGTIEARAADPGATPVAASTALETKGVFDREACLGRFEILSRTDSIYFRSGSARLEGRSEPILKTVLDIVNRCPGMMVEIAGHTDSDGGDGANQRLSELRARSVGDYLARHGVETARLVTTGFGEGRPAFDNASSEKWRNRRIEFTAR